MKQIALKTKRIEIGLLREERSGGKRKGLTRCKARREQKTVKNICMGGTKGVCERLLTSLRRKNTEECTLISHHVAVRYAVFHGAKGGKGKALGEESVSQQGVMGGSYCISGVTQKKWKSEKVHAHEKSPPRERPRTR